MGYFQSFYCFHSLDYIRYPQRQWHDSAGTRSPMAPSGQSPTAATNWGMRRCAVMKTPGHAAYASHVWKYNPQGFQFRLSISLSPRYHTRTLGVSVSTVCKRKLPATLLQRVVDRQGRPDTVRLIPTITWPHRQRPASSVRSS